MIVRMAANGVLTIPTTIRRKLGITVRTRVHMDVDEQNCKIILTPVAREHIQSLHGRYKGEGLLKAFVAGKDKD